MEISHKLDTARKEYCHHWKLVTEDWKNQKTGDAAWLTYAANYLLCTAGVHWAMDPFSMSTRIAGMQEPDFNRDLQGLEFVALTHAHNDHLDLNLIKAISTLPVKWIIPQHTLDKVLEKTFIDPQNIIIPQNGETINLGKVTLTPFDSLHFHELGGIAETGYLVEFDKKRWLFPGDVRNFDHSRLPVFTGLDGVFAHLWLGKGHAKDDQPPFLHDFASFYTSLAPARIVITHLDEFGRAENELWDENHYMLVSKEIHNMSPSVSVKMAKMGMKVIL